MKKLLIISFLLFVGSYGFGQDTLIKSIATSAGATIVSDGKLEITITERSTLTDNEYRLIMGFLFVNKNHPSKDAKQTDLHNFDYDAMYKKVKAIDFSTLKEKYVDNAAADSDLEYDFSITVDGKTYNFHVYKVKVKPLLRLVKIINRQLPEGSQIGYNKQYFNR